MRLHGFPYLWHMGLHKHGTPVFSFGLVVVVVGLPFLMRCVCGGKAAERHAAGLLPCLAPIFELEVLQEGLPVRNGEGRQEAGTNPVATNDSLAKPYGAILISPSCFLRVPTACG